MKALSIALLALTTGHAAMTGDVTALIVAFMFLLQCAARTCTDFGLRISTDKN